MLITALHLGVLLHTVMPTDGYVERYQRFVQHDGYWFLNIIGRGYQSPVPPSPIKRMEVSNVAFFPGFPLWGAAVTKALDLSPKTGLTLASQLATWGFWTYFLLIVRRRLGLTGGRCAAAVALVLAHPAAFFLIAAYSESLFLMMLTGYMLWSTSGSRWSFVLSALHGVAMTGTRIAGAPAAAFPVVRAWFQRGVDPLAWRERFASPAVWRGVALTAISAAGMIAFFIYCHVRFQHWNFYMMTQEAGWGVKADYLALFKAGAYQRWYPSWHVASHLGRFLVPMTVLGLLVLGLREWVVARRKPTAWRERLGFYFVGCALFYIAVSGVYSVRLESMTRYHFCTHVFLVPAVLHAWPEIAPRRETTRRWLVGLAALLALCGTVIQFILARQFVRGGWVA